MESASFSGGRIDEVRAERREYEKTFVRKRASGHQEERGPVQKYENRSLEDQDQEVNQDFQDFVFHGLNRNPDPDFAAEIPLTESSRSNMALQIRLFSSRNLRDFGQS